MLYDNSITYDNLPTNIAESPAYSAMSSHGYPYTARQYLDFMCGTSPTAVTVMRMEKVAWEPTRPTELLLQKGAYIRAISSDRSHLPFTFAPAEENNGYSHCSVDLTNVRGLNNLRYFDRDEWLNLNILTSPTLKSLEGCPRKFNRLSMYGDPCIAKPSRLDVG